GTAFEELGGTTVIANLVLMLTKGLPAAVTLIVFMIAVMSLSDVLNNMATMVMAGPLAIAIAVELGVNPDAFLMAAAVAASTA
ncbi:MAG TPA: SLC13 family permease, partial [Alphaproteobacteria bacterium]|nr:SLC13 family permease [Alphaproteobacteria bacterium]